MRLCQETLHFPPVEMTTLNPGFMRLSLTQSAKWHFPQTKENKRFTPIK
jgi:hypothetical protein